MRLIVGLGNPGGKYAKNRHNIGYMAVERLASCLSATAFRSRFQSMFAEFGQGDRKGYLLQPTTFMNRSGQAVSEAMRYFKLAPSDILVLHDELDLAPGKLRFKSGGGHAGHNGLRSIHAHIGADYQRLRLGIGHPGHKDQVASYVLSDFSKSDHNWLADLLNSIESEGHHLIDTDGNRFVSAVMQRMKPPRPKKAAPAAFVLPDEPKSKDALNAKETPLSPLQRLLDKFS